MNVYKELDLAIAAKLQEITSIKQVEPYNAQYLNTEKDDAKDYPATYFELLEPINWEDAGNDWQTARVTARLHIVAFNLKRDKEQLHDLGQEVFLKLDNVTLFGTGGYHLTSKWSRSASSVVKRYRQLKVMTIDFVFEAFDSSSMEQWGTQQVGFTIVPPTA